jgi:uracil-DNA glycosylase
MTNDTISAFQKIHEAIFDCTACSDKGYFVMAVQPAWDPKKFQRTTPQRWGMLIGQAPGLSEQQSGKAFQGRAGRGWEKWLLEAGFSLEQIRELFFKTSLTKCYPGQLRGKDRRPSQVEIDLCAHFLIEQIAVVQPLVLVPMGKMAIQWFFPKVSILEEVIGEQLSWQHADAAHTIICLPHASPASAWWKNPANQPRIKKASGLLYHLWRETAEKRN